MARTRIDWIDVFKPTKVQISRIAKDLHLHPVIAEELVEPSARSRVEFNDHYLYLICYFPVYDEKEKISYQGEIDFIITKSKVVTVHYQRIEPLETFKGSGAKDSLELTYWILSALLGFEDRQLRHIQEKVEQIGRDLFIENKEREILQLISYSKRDISEYRMIVRHQGIILNSLAGVGIKFWGDGAKIFLSDLLGEHLKVENKIETYRMTVADFEDTNNQIMSVKTNDVMKTFTMLSFLTFPLMLLATIFGMNTKDTPLVGLQHGFWVILGIMVLGMLTMLVYFKRKNWM